MTSFPHVVSEMHDTRAITSANSTLPLSATPHSGTPLSSPETHHPQIVASPSLEPSVEHSVHDRSETMVEGEAMATHQDEDGDIDSESGDFAKKRVSHLPSPPLTRVGTNESVREDPVDGGMTEGEAEIGEMDVAEWYSTGQDADPDLDGGRAISQDGGAPSSPTSVRPNPSQLQLQVRTPSPQPWELVDAPSISDHGIPGMYSTKKFAALQSQHDARPLVPKSSYYFGPPPPDSAYGTRPLGQIGLHHPREILRIERDYSGGGLIQFAPIFPLELEGRVTPMQFIDSINAINKLLISAHSLRHSFFDNLFAVLTLYLSHVFLTSHYEKEMRRLQHLFEYLNAELFNPVGLNILWPQKVAFLFLEIEYY